MSQIIVLGAGMVGSAMARDLVQQYDVCIADVDKLQLKRLKQKAPSLSTLQLDFADTEALQTELAPYDLVICAVPGHMGFETLKAIISAGKNVVDISFAEENCLDLDYLARKHEVTAVFDCGVAPGMDNLLLGFHNSRMQVTEFECLVGGLPRVRKKPFEYKAPFSPIDVIEEYVRPARFISHGRMVTREALSDREYLDFEQVGTLEAFNTDGLRSLMQTMNHIPNMKEKTLRYPGHVDIVRALRDSGFLSSDPIEIKGLNIPPIEMTSKILINDWKLGAREEEFTLMRVTISGEENGRHKKYVYNLYDEYDHITHTSSMARTTGYTATAVANLILRGKFNKHGVFAPESLGAHADCCKFVLGYLEERKVYYKREECQMDDNNQG